MAVITALNKYLETEELDYEKLNGVVVGSECAGKIEEL